MDIIIGKYMGYSVSFKQKGPVSLLQKNPAWALKHILYTCVNLITTDLIGEGKIKQLQLVSRLIPC